MGGDYVLFSLSVVWTMWCIYMRGMVAELSVLYGRFIIVHPLLLSGPHSQAPVKPFCRHVATAPVLTVLPVPANTSASRTAGTWP